MAALIEAVCDTKVAHVRATCIDCHKVYEFKLTAAGFLARQLGGHVQDCFPELTPAERELFQTGQCGKCWDEMFGKTEDETEEETDEEETDEEDD